MSPYTPIWKKHTLFCLFCCVWRYCFFRFVLLLLWDFSELLTYECMQSSFITLSVENSSLNSVNMLHFLISTERFPRLLSPISNTDS